MYRLYEKKPVLTQSNGGIPVNVVSLPTFYSNLTVCLTRFRLADFSGKGERLRILFNTAVHSIAFWSAGGGKLRVGGNYIYSS